MSQNIWQQAEHNSGTLDEALRMARRLRESMVGGGEPDKATGAPVRTGLLGVLDGQANDIAILREIMGDMLSLVGERGAAPITSAVGDGRWSSHQATDAAAPVGYRR